MSLFAVGDDDQNVYAFKGASVAFIRRFEKDCAAKAVHLVENYRSTADIVHAANKIIARAVDRMKAGHDIVVDRARRRDPAGGELARVDAIGRGRVQILAAGPNAMAQAVHALDELVRLSELDLGWDWARAAVIGRTWKVLDPVRSLCEARGIPVQLASDDPPGFWRLREMQSLAAWLRSREQSLVEPREIGDWLSRRGEGPWWAIIREGLEQFGRDAGERAVIAADVLDWLADWGRSVRRRQCGLLLLTAHSAKGLEFDDVVVLDGGWERSAGEDPDAERRLYYVAMTRARRSLALMRFSERHSILDGLGDDGGFLIRRAMETTIDISDCRKRYQRLDLSEVDLGYAGRLPHEHPALASLQRLSAGDRVGLKRNGERFLIVNDDGHIVGRLAKKYRPPEGLRFLEGRVFAIVARKDDDAADEFRRGLRRASWEVLVPELVFGPDG